MTVVQDSASMSMGGEIANRRELFDRLPDFESALADELAAVEAAVGPEEATALRLVLLQRWLGLGDEELLAEAGDRLSLRRFCGLEPAEPLPEAERLAALRRCLEGTPKLAERVSHLADEGRRRLCGSVPEITVVSPVYQAEETVFELVRRLREVLETVTGEFEIVLVEDGSPDRSWERIRECCARDGRVRGIKLSRNFGQHAAITAGLAEARGDWVVVMDCDLQDNPSYIPELYRHALAGAEVVYTEKDKREHGAVKNFFGRQFSRVSNWLSRGDQADPRVGAYSMISRRVVEAFLRMEDVHRHYLTLLRWLGFTSVRVPVRHERRFAGRSSYSCSALMRHAVSGIVSHSDRLLYSSIALGFGFLTVCLIVAIVLIVSYFQTGFRAGWTSTVVLILFATSVVLLSIGTVGIYIAKIFDQVKGRPLYIVEQRRNALRRVLSDERR